MLATLYLHVLLLFTSVTVSYQSLGINIATNETRKRMPVNTASFVELISTGVFVDKTPLIHALLTSADQLIAITCPKKWAKSTNMDMLRTFLAMPVHPNGTRVLPISDTPVYRLFTEGKYHTDEVNVTLEKPLLISDQKYASIRDGFLGRYPVIYLSLLNNDPTDSNHSRKVSEAIATAYSDHKYMIDVYDTAIRTGNATEKREIESKKKDFLSFLEGSACYEGIYLDNLDRSVYFLCEELHRYFDTKVFVLADGFDKFLHTYVSDTVQFVLSHAFKNNPHLFKGVVAGVLPVGWESEVAFNEFLDSPYHRYYGFTKDEVNALTCFYRIPSQEQKKLEYCYNGYKTKSGEKMYNPWNTCNYINSGQLKPYWIDAENRDLYLNKTFELPQFQFVIGRLITGACYDSSFIYSSFMDTNVKFVNEENALRYLTAVGYLTVDVKSARDTNETDQIHSRIPNFEISSHMQRLLQLKLSKLYDNELLQLLRSTSILWEQFLASNYTISRELDKRMEECFDSLTTYAATYIYPVDSAEALIHYLAMSIVSSNKFDFVASQFEIEKPDKPEVKLRPDIVLSSRPKGRGFFIDLRYISEENEDDERLNVTRVKYYGDVLKKYTLLHDWNDIKFVNCTLFANKMVEIRSSLHSTQLIMKPKKKSLMSYLNQMGIE